MPAANDAFASAIVLGGTSGTSPIDTTGATYETGEPANTLGADGAASVWYEWNLGASSTGLGWRISLDTDATPEMWDSTLEVFTGTDLSDLVLVGSGDDIDYPTNVHSIIIDLDVPDGTVWIRADQWGPYTGYSGADTSDGVLTYTAVPIYPFPGISFVRDATDTTTLTFVIAGDTVLVHGTDLEWTTSVLFGAGAAGFTIDSPTQLTVTVPIGATNGTGNLVVANPQQSASTTMPVRYPGPWITPAPIYGDTATSGWTYRTSDRQWITPGGDYLGGADGSAPDGFGVINGTAEHSYEAEITGEFPQPETAVQGAGYIVLGSIMDEPDYNLAAWLDPEPNEVLDPMPPDAVGWQWQNPTLNNGTFLDAYRLNVNAFTGPTSDTDELQMRRLTDSEYTRYDAGAADPATIAADWHFPSDLAGKDLLFTYTGPVEVGATILGHIDLDAADLDSPDGVLAFVPTIASYVAGSYPSEDTFMGIRDLFPQLLYQPDNFRWLYDSPQAPLSTGWRVGSIALT